MKEEEGNVRCSLCHTSRFASLCQMDIYKDVVHRNLEALGFSYKECQLERELWVKKPIDTALFFDLTHFLFTELDRQEAEKRFATCWPATDGASQRDFRVAVSDWLTEMTTEAEAAPFVSAFIPRILHYPWRAECFELYAGLSTYVLQRCLDSTGFKRMFRGAKKSMLMEYSTDTLRANEAALQEKDNSVKEDGDQLMRELQKHEQDACSRLRILKEQSYVNPPSQAQQIEEEAKAFAKQLEDLSSFLTTWDKFSSVLSDTGHKRKKDKTFDGGKFQKDKPLDVVSLLQKYKEDLNAFADKIESPDSTPFADALPVLELQLRLRKEWIDQARTIRAKLEAMEIKFKATIEECEKVLESRPLRPLPEIIIDGHVCNFDPFPSMLDPRRSTSASSGDCSISSKDMTDTVADVTVIERALNPTNSQSTTPYVPEMDKVITAFSDPLLLLHSSDSNLLTAIDFQELYDSKEMSPDLDKHCS